MRKSLWLLLCLSACSASPPQHATLTGLVLNGGPTEDSLTLANAGSTIALAPADKVADDNGAFGVFADTKLEQGLITPPVVMSPTDGGWLAGSVAIYLCDATAGAKTMYLPLADAGLGRNYTLIKQDTTAHGCIASITGSDTIWQTVGSSTTFSLPDAGSDVQLLSDGISKWWVVNAR